MSTRRTVQIGLWVLLAVSFVLALVVVPTPAGAQQRVSAVISTMTGRVEVLSNGQTAWQPARLGMPVFEGDQVRAFAGANAELRLPDASTVLVAENTRFAVTRLDYTPQNQMRAAFFHLAVGKIRGFVAQVAVRLVQARQNNFAITTPTAVAAVRGTEIYASFDPATGQTTFMVANGTAIIRDIATGQLVTVTAPPGQPQIVTQAQGQALTAPVPATAAQVNQMTSTANPVPPGSAAVLTAPIIVIVNADTVLVQITAAEAGLGAPAPTVVVTPAPPPTTRETEASPF